ncbi:MAG: hypothetical protein NVV82_16545 [Sporocytophaga sp.]|nr:hypothetical protein [Sporocytophaga sp.]
MKTYIFFFFMLLTALSCKESDNTANSVATDNYENHIKELRCVYSKSKYSKDSVFPFNESNKIEFIAYDSTSQADFFGGRIIKMKEPHDSLSSVRIRERVKLNGGQIDTLFSILHDYKINNDNTFGEAAACYNPRHAILFYKNNKLIEILEICFECQQLGHIDKRSEFGVMCHDKWCYLIQYFMKCGIKTNYSIRDRGCGKNQFS